MLASEPEEFPETWEPSPEPNLLQRWLKGWRLVLVLTVLALNLVGEGLNDALNPRLRGR